MTPRHVGVDLLPLDGLEIHHILKRAQGGSDFDLDRLVALCPPCHVQTDAPYARGRLVISPRGAGHFTVEVTRGADKWAIRAQPTAVSSLDYSRTMRRKSHRASGVCDNSGVEARHPTLARRLDGYSL